MNPFLFKAHPLLRFTVELLTDPAGHPPKSTGSLLFFYLVANLVWATALGLVIRKTVRLRPSVFTLYWMALPALIGYVPICLTLLGDILDHAFRFADRFILVFALLIVASMLGAGYGFLVRYPRSGQPIGLNAGLAIALTMLLLSLPLSLILLKTDLLASLL